MRVEFSVSEAVPRPKAVQDGQNAKAGKHQEVEPLAQKSVQDEMVKDIEEDQDAYLLPPELVSSGDEGPEPMAIQEDSDEQQDE